MKRYVVRLNLSARNQITVIRQWWMANRPSAADLFDRELDAAVETLSRTPLISSVYCTLRGIDVRRVVLARSRYTVYFLVEGEAVEVIAVWHAARGSGPELL